MKTCEKPLIFALVLSIVLSKSHCLWTRKWRRHSWTPRRRVGLEPVAERRGRKGRASCSKTYLLGKSWARGGLDAVGASPDWCHRGLSVSLHIQALSSKRLLELEPNREAVASYGDRCPAKLRMVPSRLAPFSKNAKQSRFVSTSLTNGG